MRAAARILALTIMAGTGAAAASAPDTSPRPLPRPVVEGAATDTEVARAEPEAMRPRMTARDSVAAASLVPLPRTAAPPPPAAGRATGGSATPAVAPIVPAVPPPLRPAMPRGAGPSVSSGAAPSLVLAALAPPPLRPPPRPGDLADAVVAPVAPAAPLALAVARSPRPEPRPAPGVRTTPGGVSLVAAFRTRPQPELSRPAPQGRLCGVVGIEGDTVAPVVSRVNGCGIAEPVRVRAVEGVRLSAGALMDCPTALALQSWVRDAVIPVVGDIGGGVSSLTVGSHYACRPRNNQTGARLSEHGRGRAIDISAIVLADGTPITVLNGWGDARQGPILRELHRAACGPFGTVLGPDSDRFHRDHFHFDTARHRTGTFCR
jgi:hypothetical protein